MTSSWIHSCESYTSTKGAEGTLYMKPMVLKQRYGLTIQQSSGALCCISTCILTSPLVQLSAVQHFHLCINHYYIYALAEKIGRVSTLLAVSGKSLCFVSGEWLCINRRQIKQNWDFQLLITLDPSSAPLQPKLLPKTLASAFLSWVPPTDSSCASSYTLILINVTEENASYFFNTITNITSMTVSDLTQGAEYSFTVAGVDAEGREGESSNSSSSVMLDSEC